MSGHGELEISGHDAGMQARAQFHSADAKQQVWLCRSICITTACTHARKFTQMVPCNAGTDAGIG